MSPQLITLEGTFDCIIEGFRVQISLSDFRVSNLATPENVVKHHETSRSQKLGEQLEIVRIVLLIRIDVCEIESTYLGGITDQLLQDLETTI